MPPGVPHATTEDDVYEGYFIPKGLLFYHDSQWDGVRTLKSRT